MGQTMVISGDWAFGRTANHSAPSSGCQAAGFSSITNREAAAHKASCKDQERGMGTVLGKTPQNWLFLLKFRHFA